MPRKKIRFIERFGMITACICLPCGCGTSFFLADFSKTWKFTNVSEYTFDSNKLQITDLGNGAGRVSLKLNTSSSLTRSDQTSSQFFSLGVQSPTASLVYNSTSSVVTLNATTAGTFTSRVFSGALSSTSWKTLAWKTQLPYWKNLPNSASSESTSTYSNLYSSTLMNGIVFLFHPSGTIGNAVTHSSGTTDSSGQSIAGTYLNSGSGMNYAAGKLNQSLTYDGSNDYVDFGNPSVLPDAALPKTMCAWFLTNSTAAGYRLIVSYGTAGTSNSNGLAQLNAGDLIGSGYGNDLVESNVLSTGVWYHSCMTYDGTTAKISLNGVIIDSQPKTWNIIRNKLMVGAQVTAVTTWNGNIDEVAIWSRALDPSEILQLYRRGINRVKFQIRTWSATTNPQCTGTQSFPTCPNFVGPLGSTTAYYSELNSISASGPSFNITDSGGNNPTGTYFQYQATLQTDDVNYLPDLKSVSITALGTYDDAGPTLELTSGAREKFVTLDNLFKVVNGPNHAGTVTYQLRADDQWYYYDTTQSKWTAATAADSSQSSTQADIQNNLQSFGALFTGSKNLAFRAFFNSDGGQIVELDSIQLSGKR